MDPRRTLISRDVTFKEDSFLKDDKVDHPKDGRETGKAVAIEQRYQIHEAAMQRPMDLAADQPSSSAGSPMAINTACRAHVKKKHTKINP